MPSRTIRTLLLTLLAAVATHAQPSSDEATLRQLIADHQRASEKGDLRGLVDIYASDAQTVSLSGKVVRGREAIEADYRALLATASTRSGRHHTHPTDSIKIEFVTPDVALIEVASVNVGGTNAAGQPMADSRVLLVTMWRKTAGQWLVVYQRAIPAPTA
ncbi:MAG: SgcJ/EcaC family oxidoreductase [Cyanobacteria bacterium]|nr:SgcJ/EcaC family oxidoreductase [Cyanobacteriota bacterium]